jgi:signal peptidase I
MPRVHEVARDLGLSSREVLAQLEEMGEPARSQTSSIDAGVVERLRAQNGGARDAGPGASAPAATSTTPAATTPAPPAERTRSAKDGTAPAPTESGEAGVRRGVVHRRKKPPRSTGVKILSQIAELPLLVLVAFLIAVVIKTFVMQAFYIPSGSMTPTLRVGDRVLVEKVTYLLGGPGRGQVVVFARSLSDGNGVDFPWYRDVQNYVRELLGLPTGREEDFIKRVVAVGGESISYQGSPRRLYVNGEPVEEDYLKRPDRNSSVVTSDNCNFGKVKMEKTAEGCMVPAGSVFVMGDNRNNSADSRSIGPVDEDRIVGRAFVIIWPPDDFGGL